MKRVAFQGVSGAFGEEAARAYWGEIDSVACAQFVDVIDAVTVGTADVGMLPVENSEAGTVAGMYALLGASSLQIVGEIELRVRHCLLALPGETLQSIREVHSHPQALMQCDRFLSQHGYIQVASSNTAASAKFLAETKPRGVGVIASARSAQLYSLDCLASGIESNSNNITRFVAVAASPAPKHERSKTSIVFTTANVPGALYRALGVFAERHINMTKLESSPNRQVPWEYSFYIDVEGHQQDVPMREAIAALNALCSFVRVVGSYAAAGTSAS